MIDSKDERYNDLVKRRKTCSLCKELCNTAKVPGYSKFDTQIGPWTRWQGNLAADLMIVGQDWGNVRLLQKNNLMQDEYEVKSNRTSINLREMLNKALGIEIDWKLRGKDGKFFFTNAVLCLRDNDMPMQGKAKQAWFDNCVGEEKFLRQQIEIVNPKVVVGLGRLAFNNILSSFDLEKFPPSMKLSEIVQDKKGVKLPETRAKAFAVYHCGAAGWNINRLPKDHLRDWKRIRDALDA